MFHSKMSILQATVNIYVLKETDYGCNPQRPIATAGRAHYRALTRARTVAFRLICPWREAHDKSGG